MLCPTCNRPTDQSPYREMEQSAIEIQKVSKLVSMRRSFRSLQSRFALWMMKSNTTRSIVMVPVKMIAGLTVLSMIVGGFWLLFPGLTRLGAFVDDHIWHCIPNQDVFAQRIFDWIFGLLSVVFGGVLPTVSYYIGSRIVNKHFPTFADTMMKRLSK